MAAGETRPTHAAPSTMPYISVDALVGDGPVAPPPTLADGGRVSENARDWGASPANVDEDPKRVAWRANYTAELARVLSTPANDYHDSAARLSGLVKSALLEFRHLKTEPSKFFEAHRLLVNHGFEQGPGFSIRFTVQYNLFAGTVLELGGSEHLRTLDEMQRDGELGCFALTEKLAGVNSGLVVQTTARWVPDKGAFLLHTPHDGACKNWISQGLTACKAVVMADLIVGGESKGPHAFLVELRAKGSGPGYPGRVSTGVTLGDMGAKTTGNDLDNAWISFENKWIPRESLLDRYCDLTVDGGYVATGGTSAPMSNMELIGQRLFTGRVAVAQGAHEFRRRLFRRTRAHNDAKPCWAPGGGSHSAKKTLMLSSVPQLRALYRDADAREARMTAYLASVERDLCETLTNGTRPSAEMVEAVAAAKVSAVDEAIEYCHRLKQEVGSYALMAGTGFEHTDFLQCCKFAEGDSRILLMKVARDRVKAYGRIAAKGGEVPAWMSPREAKAVAELAKALQASAAGGKRPAEAWEEHWDKAYATARLAVDNIVTRRVGGPDKWSNAGWRSTPASRL